MASPKTPPPNKVRELREALGLTKVELSRMAKLSDKTIARVERQEQEFRVVTYHRILNALNEARKKVKASELQLGDVFTGLEGLSADSK